MEKNKEMAMEEAAKCYPAAEAEYQQVVENAELFFHKLTNFHSSFSNNFSSPSISIGGTSLDLHRLFVEVTSHGGLDQVIRDRKWKEVVSAFKLPLTSISKSFLLRKHYVSLLYHFEQVYFFRKSVSPLPIAEAVNKIPCIRSTAESASKVYKASTALSLLPAVPQIQPGVSIVGIINEKFDNGYVVSVNVGSDQLKGILYHTPDTPQLSWNPNPCKPHFRKRKNSCLTLVDPSKPMPTRSGCNFSDHYPKLTSVSQGQEEHISKNIGNLWDKLSE